MYSMDEISQMAKDNAVMPSDFTNCEQYLFSILRLIYAAYSKGLIDSKEGKREKDIALKNYKDMELAERIYRRQRKECKAIGQLTTEIEKNGCELCKQIAKIYDGRITI